MLPLNVHMWPKGLLALPSAVGGRTHAIIQAQTLTSPSPTTYTPPLGVGMCCTWTRTKNSH